MVHKPTNITGVAPPCAMQGVGKQYRKMWKNHGTQKRNMTYKCWVFHIFFYVQIRGSTKKSALGVAQPPSLSGAAQRGESWWGWKLSRLEIPSGKPTKKDGKSQFLMGKYTISMVIFNSYAKLAEGTIDHTWKVAWHQYIQENYMTNPPSFNGAPFHDSFKEATLREYKPTIVELKWLVQGCVIQDILQQLPWAAMFFLIGSSLPLATSPIRSKSVGLKFSHWFILLAIIPTIKLADSPGGLQP